MLKPNKTFIRQFLLLLAILTSSINTIPAQAAPNPIDLQWHACPAPPSNIPDAGQQCSTLQVPLDYQDPDGHKIQVAISRIPASDPTKRRGVLLLNPGGPGHSGINMPRSISALAPASLSETYDLIGFDPRGVGQSTPVTCGLTPSQATQAFVPLTQNDNFNDTAAFMRQVADSCAIHAGGLLPYMTTANTARDMDQIRLALGETKINYLGYSYGTALGAAYTSLFPDTADRFVIDSTVSPSLEWRNIFRAWGLADYTRFPDFAKFAAANDAVYHLGSTETAVRQTYFELIKQLDQHPIAYPNGAILNDELFRESTFTSLYQDTTFPDLARLWQSLKTSPNNQTQPVLGALTLPATITPGVPTDNTNAAALAIVCDDVSWSHSPSQYQHELSLDQAVFPLFGELGSNITPCAYWPSQPIEPKVRINAARNQVLIVQNLRDPATPYFEAVQMHHALGARSHLVSVDQGGHMASYLKPNTCANNATTTFLVKGDLPKGDLFCPASVLP